MGHCQSALGIARQLSATLELPYHLPDFSLPKEEFDNPLSIEVSSEDCPLYSTRSLQDISMIPTPLALRFTLQRCGLRSINYVVDITNLMMLLYGQPMHAFDLDQLQGSKISVKKGSLENFTTLDNQPRSAKELLLIQDANSPIAIAGVMGGLHSSVSERTKNILLEAAYFSSSAIVQSQKKLGYKTESSIRFEKGIDPEITLHALNHASQILSSLCHGKLSTLSVYKKTFSSKSLSFHPKKAAQFLGVSLTGSEMESMLKRLECKTKRDKSGEIEVTPPLYRHDLNQPIDLIEEIAKLYGFNTIPKSNPSFRMNRFQNSPLRELQSRSREILTKLGLYEIITCDLISESLAEKSHDPMIKNRISTIYSKSKEHSILRSSLFGSHLEVVKENLSHGNKDLSFFELSYLHTKQEEKIKEHLAAGIIVTGALSPHHFSSETMKWDFFSLKGLVEQFFTGQGASISFETSSHPFFHPYKQQLLSKEGKTLGVLGEIHPNYLSSFDIKEKVLFAQIDLFSLLEIEKSPFLMEPLPQFPGTQRDWTIPLSKETPVQTLLDKIEECNSSLLQKVVVWDRYEDPSNPEVVHITLRFYYRDPYKTLSHEEAEKEHSRIVEQAS